MNKVQGGVTNDNPSSSGYADCENSCIQFRECSPAIFVVDETTLALLLSIQLQVSP